MLNLGVFFTFKESKCFLLTAKFEGGNTANNGATAVKGEALVRPSIAPILGVINHKVSRHQGVVRILSENYICAIHTPPVKNNILILNAWTW